MKDRERGERSETKRERERERKREGERERQRDRDRETETYRLTERPCSERKKNLARRDRLPLSEITEHMNSKFLILHDSLSIFRFQEALTYLRLQL